MEAVVKSLDPISSNNREATIDAATEILVHVVQTLVSPAVDYFRETDILVVSQPSIST